MLIGLRALYGIAMGGEWGVGAALALESVPRESRGAISGILQQGYPLGYLLASVLFGLFFSVLGWRGMFVVGALPAGSSSTCARRSPSRRRGRRTMRNRAIS